MTKEYGEMKRVVQSSRRDIQFWKNWTLVAHITTRTSLIVLAAIVAAQKNLIGSPLNEIVNWVPVLSLIVAILTAFDTWLKPGEKWSAHRRFVNKMWDMETELELISGSDVETIRKMNQEFIKIREVHQQESAF